MNSPQTVYLHDFDSYFKSRNLVDDRHRPYYLRWLDKSVDPRSGAVRRHHVDEQVLQHAMREAVVRAGIAKPAHVHTLRHSFATSLLAMFIVSRLFVVAISRF